jgi:3-hydroxyacyl-CoA dehydrogenase/3a,7a,12a-trihydroxy-5b-cholest-24-enoyl-CoA hydratase
MYFAGKLKIAGNVMAAQKLEFLKQIDATKVTAASKPSPSAAATPVQAQGGEGQAKAVFARLAERLGKGGAAEGAKGTVQFRVKAPDSAWVVDLRSAPGKVREGADAKTDVTLTLTDECLVALASGARTAQDMFMRGDLRVDGDVTLAHRLGFMKQLI